MNTVLPPVTTLDSLLTESLAQAAESFSLEALLDESMQAAKEAQSVKDLRQKMAGGFLSKDDAKIANAAIRSWEARREWNKAFNTISFTRYFCSCCGSYYPQFEAFGEEQTHRHHDSVRWVKVDSHTTPNLPRKTLYKDVMVPLCEACAEEAGWEIEVEEEETELEEVESEAPTDYDLLVAMEALLDDEAAIFAEAPIDAETLETPNA